MKPAARPTQMPAGAGPSVIAFFGGLLGAAGVALAAVAAHLSQAPQLATAATMLIVHATAALAISAIAPQSPHGRHWLWVGGLMLGAAALFSGDIALNTLQGAHIFPFAAPTGGSLLIASWLAVALAAALDWRQRRES